jgi:UDP-glucuronate 4-epimerase
MKTIFVTGAAGFIGYHFAERCLSLGHRVVSVDSINDYYDVDLKKSRLKLLLAHPNFEFHPLHLEDREGIFKLFKAHRFDRVVHLAAQAGVRYSLENPYAYIQSNIDGMMSILEGCRHHSIEHLIFASSSSVYGLNSQQPFSTGHHTDHPVSLYAATKKANEMFAHCYAHLYKIPCTGLRFFTVYGPWGRPDMALFKFTKAIFEDSPVDVYNNGKMKRDFTFVDDIVDAMVPLMDIIPQSDPNWDTAHPDPSTSSAPYRIYNIGNNQPTELSHFIAVLEQAIGKKAVLRYLPMQPGDVLSTYADVDSLANAVGFRPKTNIEEGVAKFVAWYRDYYNV